MFNKVQQFFQKTANFAMIYCDFFNFKFILGAIDIYSLRGFLNLQGIVCSIQKNMAALKWDFPLFERFQGPI